MKKCAWHLCQNQTKNKYCGVKCKNKSGVNTRRQKLKLLAIEYKGGSCILCKYNKCPAALCFHHLDPTQKDFSLGHSGCTYSWEKSK